MHGFAAPIYLGSPTSRLCYVAVCILHAFAVLVCIILPLALIPRAFICIMFGLSFWITYRTYRRTRRGLISALLRSDDSWQLLTTSFELLNADYASRPFATKMLMIIYLIDQRGDSWLVTVAADNVPANLRRRLMVRLQIRI